MKNPILSINAKLLSGLGLLMLLCACAAPSVAPSPALQQTLDSMVRTQQQQAEQIQALQQQLRSLSHQLSAARGQQQDTGTLASNLPKPQMQKTAPPPTLVTPSPAMEGVPELTDAAATYLMAFTNLAKGRYTQAEQGFAQFLNDYPQHRYTANARYWLAQSLMEQQRDLEAMSTLRQIIVDPQGQAKAPAALIQLAHIYKRQAQPIEAEEVLEQLRNRYPNSPEAQHLDRSPQPLAD